LADVADGRGRGGYLLSMAIGSGSAAPWVIWIKVRYWD
jgi:hypothetical protein